MIKTKTFTKSQTREIQKYMGDEAGDHVDWLTNEVSATTLNEVACEHFDTYIGPSFNITEVFFELNQQVAEYNKAIFLADDCL